MNKRMVLFVIGLVVAGLFTAWSMIPTGFDESHASMAEYELSKLTCGSCVNKIETALASLPGIGLVDINLTSSRGRVTYNPADTDAKSIADTISRAGYPAKLVTELSPEEYSNLKNEETRLGQKYVARIGDRLLTRTSFETSVQQMQGDRQLAPSQRDALWRKTWDELRQRELLLHAAEVNNVLVQATEVDARLDELRQMHPGFAERVITQYGDVEVFRKRLHEDMTINRNLEEHVFSGVTDPNLRQAKLQKWYTDLTNRTEVVIFDTQLKAASTQGGGCGGGCCG